MMARLINARLSWQILGAVLILSFWEIYGRQVSPILLPSLSRVLGELWLTVVNGRLLIATRESLLLLFTGVGIATVTGVVTGLIIGRWPKLDAILQPYIQILYASPRIALIPLVILWLGVGFWGKVFLVFLSSYFEVLIATVAGVRHVGTAYVEVARSFMLPERELFTKVILPGALPFVISGLRLGIGHGLVGVIASELFMQANGIGGLVVVAAGGFRTDRVLAALLLVSLAGVVIAWALRLVERKAAPWQKETFE